MFIMVQRNEKCSQVSRIFFTKKRPFFYKMTVLKVLCPVFRASACAFNHVLTPRKPSANRLSCIA